MKKIIILFISIFMFISCNKDIFEPEGGIVIDMFLYVKVADTNGVNILDSEGGIAFDDITLFYHLNDEWIPHYGYSSRVNRGLKLMELNGEKVLLIPFGGDIYNSNYTDIKLKFSEGSTDHLKAEVSFDFGMKIVRIWCNEELRWDKSNSNGVRIITITK